MIPFIFIFNSILFVEMNIFYIKFVVVVKCPIFNAWRVLNCKNNPNIFHEQPNCFLS